MHPNSILTLKTLRSQLHACPEISGQEQITPTILQLFLKAHTSLELCACGDGFYAAHRETRSLQPAIALRADYDALALPNGDAAHLCGHDGHSAALCGIGLMLEGAILNRNVFLLFQPAEETGQGAQGCTALLDQERVDEIYAVHNLPGFPFGRLVTCPGTFACASTGLTLTFRGRMAHAAYPEEGISPAPGIGQLLCELPRLASPSRYPAMVLCTVAGVQMGQKAFGSAADKGELWLTLRGERNQDLNQLRQTILTRAENLACNAHLDFSWEEQDTFPATENTPACAEHALSLCNGIRLSSPMRWSEDFGHYLLRCPGAYLGIGAGAHYPPLHTASYDYPDELLAPTMHLLWKLLSS